MKPANWQLFMPFGMEGVLRGAALVIFAYLGLDAVASAAEKVKNPQRNRDYWFLINLILRMVENIA